MYDGIGRGDRLEMAINRSDIKHCPPCGGEITLKEDIVRNVEKLVLTDSQVGTVSVLRMFRCNSCDYFGYWMP